MVGESLHLPGPCPTARTPQSSQRSGVIPLPAGALVSGSAPPSPPQSLFLHISLLLFGRMSERDIQSLSKWVLVLSLCLTTLWGRLTLASMHHHRSHSGRGTRPCLHVSHACAIMGPHDNGSTLGSSRDVAVKLLLGVRSCEYSLWGI